MTTRHVFNISKHKAQVRTDMWWGKKGLSVRGTAEPSQACTKHDVTLATANSWVNTNNKGVAHRRGTKHCKDLARCRDDTTACRVSMEQAQLITGHHTTCSQVGLGYAIACDMMSHNTNSSIRWSQVCAGSGPGQASKHVWRQQYGVFTQHEHQASRH